MAQLKPALHIRMCDCRSLLFIESLSLSSFDSFNCVGWWIFLAQ